MLILLISGAVTFSLGNFWARKRASYLSSKELDPIGVLISAIAGLVVFFLGFIAFQNPVLRLILFYLLIFKFIITGLAISLGIAKGLILRQWNTFENSFTVLLGHFHTDPNRSSLHQITQLVIRHTWELIQTELGYTYSILRIVLGRIHQVKLFCGMTYIIRCQSHLVNGVSISNFININQRKTKINFIDDYLAKHEYGHTFQSQIWGPAYLLVIGIPSLCSALFTKNHHQRWYERQTDHFAKQYFGKFFGVEHERKFR